VHEHLPPDCGGHFRVVESPVLLQPCETGTDMPGDGVEFMVFESRPDLAAEPQRAVRPVGQPETERGEFKFEKTEVKRGIVCDQCRIADKITKIREDLKRGWLPLEHPVGDAVHIGRPPRDLTVGVDQALEFTGDLGTAHCDRPDLNDAVAGFWRETARFGIKNYNIVHICFRAGIKKTAG